MTRDVKPECLDEYPQSLVRTLRLPTEEDWNKVLKELKQTKFLRAKREWSTGQKDARCVLWGQYLEFCVWRAGDDEKFRMQLQYYLSSS